MVQNVLQIKFYAQINGNRKKFELCFLFKVNHIPYLAILDKYSQKSRNLRVKMEIWCLQVETFNDRANILKTQNSSVPLAKSGFQYWTVVKNWFLSFFVIGTYAGGFQFMDFQNPIGVPYHPQLSFSGVRTFCSNPFQPIVVIYCIIQAACHKKSNKEEKEN